MFAIAQIGLPPQLNNRTRSSCLASTLGNAVFCMLSEVNLHGLPIDMSIFASRPKGKVTMTLESQSQLRERFFENPGVNH